MKNFDPFDLANEISVYFESWQECELPDDTRLNKRQLSKLVKLIQQHPEAQQIYNDFELWFSHNSLREDVMSDTFTDILDEAFEEMFETA
jgi:hypothetical protein